MLLCVVVAGASKVVVLPMDLVMVFVLNCFEAVMEWGLVGVEGGTSIVGVRESSTLDDDARVLLSLLMVRVGSAVIVPPSTVFVLPLLRVLGKVTVPGRLLVLLCVRGVA